MGSFEKNSLKPIIVFSVFAFIIFYKTIGSDAAFSIWYSSLKVAAMALPIAAFINVIIKLPNGINNAVAELPNVIAVTMLDIGMLIIFSVVISILTFAYWQIKSP